MAGDSRTIRQERKEDKCHETRKRKEVWERIRKAIVE
jgi:hypothetical protein